MSTKDEAQDWRQLCQIALFELDLLKRPARIAAARNAVLDRIEDNHSKSSDEQQSLRNALDTLDTLRQIAERGEGTNRKVLGIDVRYGWHAAYEAAVLETDWTQMEARIDAAEIEIHRRRLVLSQHHGGTQEERNALVNALSSLRSLRIDAAVWEDQNKRCAD